MRLQTACAIVSLGWLGKGIELQPEEVGELRRRLRTGAVSVRER
jgi:hypothetical protein